MKSEEYFKNLETNVKVVYSVAEEAKSKGLDPRSKVEIPLATSLAEKVAGLIATVYPQVNNPSIIKRFKELEKEYGVLDPAVCLKIAEEVAKEKFCRFKSLLESIDAGIRVALAYVTLGVVSSPIEGFTYFKLNKTKENKDYFSLYYSGPIRSAGGTGAAFSLVIADYLRELFGFAKYDPDEKEIKRTITEVFDYHDRITNLQYLPTEEEIEWIAKNIPLQVNGEASEKREVSNYKDLKRVETNFIRSGMCLTLAEGLAQKAPKIWKMIKKLRENGFQLKDWDFLEEYIEIHNKREKGKTSEGPTYIKDLVAGRPVLGHPSRKGSFRLRYGRARNTGYSCLAVHPATMFILEEFIGIGTQIKIELPTKGAAISSCDSIEGPIIRLKNGTVKRVSDVYEAKKLSTDVEEIIYSGDLLVPYGDFANRNYHLVPAGYCEQEWWQQLKEKLKERKEGESELEQI
jgi:DNA polymerase II large subunit